MSSRRVHLSWLVLSLACAISSPSAAQNDQSPCTTKSQCDLQADIRDMRARRQEWDANAKQQQDYETQRQQFRAQARAEAESGKLTRIQEIMRRRREAAAAAK